MKYWFCVILTAVGLLNISAAPPTMPVGHLKLRGTVDLMYGEQPAFSQSGGSAVLPAPTRLRTHSDESTVSLRNGDSVVLGSDTLLSVDGAPDAPEVKLERGAMALLREHDSKAVFRAGEWLVTPRSVGSMTAYVSYSEAGVVEVRAFDGHLDLVAPDGTHFPIQQGQHLRIRPAEDGKVQAILTQDDLGPAPENEDLVNPELKGDDEVRDEEDDDEAAYLIEDTGGDEVLFGLGWLGLGAATAGTVAVVGGGIALENEINDDDDDDGGEEPQRPRRPVSPINNQQMEEEPTNGIPEECIDNPASVSGIICPERFQNSF